MYLHLQFYGDYDLMYACKEIFCHVIENVFKTYVNVNCTMQKKRDALSNLIRICYL